MDTFVTSGLELPVSCALIAGAGLFYAAKRHVDGCKVRVISAKPTDNESDAGAIVRNHCPSLVDGAQAYMVPTPYLIGGMVQTVYSTVITAKRDSGSDVRYEREAKVLDDGGTVSLDWYPSRPTAATKAETVQPIIVLLPGVGGSSSEYHIRSTAKALAAVGPAGTCTVVVVNHRGAARTPLTSPKLYNAYDTSDYRDCVRHVSECFPDAPLVGVGFSLGANLLTKYLGEQGDKSPLVGAVAICCPFDVEVAGRALDKRGFLNDRVFQPNLVATLKRLVTRNMAVFKSKYSDSEIDAIMRATRMSQLDDLVTAKVYGHKDCWEYYKAASSTSYVDSISIPFLAINAEDDPITPYEGIPVEKFEANPHLALVLAKHGGHLGMFTGLRPTIWYIRPVAEFLDAVLRGKK
ncbi:hypothetical protein LPJ81_003791 [Coemansia sp. IMI 209127]|nr:hypothetical protein LPJ81_003791 [Coemansia sp. IMI 209127]